MLGSKKDQNPYEKVLTPDQMSSLAEFNTDDSIRLQEVSAMTAYGINEVFDDRQEER